MAANRIVTQIRRGSSGSQAELEAAQPQPVTMDLSTVEVLRAQLAVQLYTAMLLRAICEKLDGDVPDPSTVWQNEISDQLLQG